MADRVVSSNTAVIRTGVAPKVGGWLTIDARSRQGSHASTTALSALRSTVTWADQGRILTAEQLWRIYQVSAEVRAAINGIARRVSTWDWYVEPEIDVSDPQYEAIAAEAADVATFLSAPNEDGETWQTVCTKMIIDLLVFDATAVEIVRNARDELAELVVLRGADLRPEIDGHGVLLGYIQDATNISTLGASITERPRFAPDDLMFMRLFPTTSSPEGMPLLEALVNEVITIIRSSEHLMRAVDADEIPPGILVLAGLDANAAKTAKADFVHNKGKDHQIRVITTANPQATGASWVELRRTPKELTLHEALDQVRRLIWRTFGVLPIEMGETDSAPRAQAEVQVEVGTSHLLEPILEMFAAAINMRVLPLRLSDAARGKVKFYFDREAKLRPAERSNLATTHEKYIKNGILTRNEVRKELGFAPFGPEGDVPTVEQGNRLMPLVEALKKPEPVAAPAPFGKDDPEDDPEDEPKDPKGGGVEDKDEAAEAPEEAPGEVEAAERGRRVGRAVRTAPQARLPLLRSAADLPSDWQPNGRFKGYRTLDLRRLGDDVVEYSTRVAGFWAESQREIEADVAAAARDGKLTPEEVASLSSRVGSALSTLETKWAADTRRIYAAVAKDARDRATDWTQLQVAEDYSRRADIYHQRAMGWLSASDGPISIVRARILRAIDVEAAQQSEQRSALAPRGVSNRAIPSLGERLLLGVTSAFAAQEFRIDNWAGRLLDLAYGILLDGLIEGRVPNSTPDDPSSGLHIVTPDQDAAGDGRASADWWCEWVVVGDKNMCTTCESEGAQGFRPVRALTRQPGGDTQCRARCRCVITFWSEAEVKNGTAVSLRQLP